MIQVFVSGAGITRRITNHDAELQDLGISVHSVVDADYPGPAECAAATYLLIRESRIFIGFTGGAVALAQDYGAEFAFGYQCCSECWLIGNPETMYHLLKRVRRFEGADEALDELRRIGREELARLAWREKGTAE